MNPGHYRFAVTCPHCGGDLAHVASGATYKHRTCALVACTECGSRLKMDVTLSVLDGPAIRDTLPPAPEKPAPLLATPGHALIRAIMAAERAA